MKGGALPLFLLTVFTGIHCQWYEQIKSNFPSDNVTTTSSGSVHRMVS